MTGLRLLLHTERRPNRDLGGRSGVGHLAGAEALLGSHDHGVEHGAQSYAQPKPLRGTWSVVEGRDDVPG
jgi:hypothetical protein